MKILLIGPQGSGKSTQGKMLASLLNIPFISTGDIFRDISKEDSEEGRRINQILNSGNLVDDATVIDLVDKRVKQQDCINGFILDGTPRTDEQAEKLQIDFDKVIYLKIPKEKVIERLLKRSRLDDTEDLIEQRLELYFDQTQPLLDYYKKKGSLVEIDANLDIQTIQDEIKKYI